MKIKSGRSILYALLATLTLAARANANSPVDCNCLANLPALQTNGCPAYVPDLCALGANCFSTNMLPGSCLQSLPAGSLVPPGTNNISVVVMDTQSNAVFCQVAFVVTPPPNPVLTLTCVPNKTVECGSSWMFDVPAVSTTCCDPFMAVIIVGDVTNGVCPKVITRTWQVTNSCGLSASCNQKVTLVDTTPPTALCSGVELVPNGNFELHNACPTILGQISLAAPWFPASDGTCDYFHSCAPNPAVSTPANSVGFQAPLSGQGYAGISVYGNDVGSPSNSYREYIEVPLLTPLVAGQTYRVSYHVSRAENYASAVAELGACFSSGPIISNGYAHVLNLVPQVVNPSTNLLISATSWMLVQGTFVAAGGEGFMTLGNFLTDAGTTAVPASGLYTNRAYYYYDDVSVVALCPGTVTNKTVACGSAWTFDPPAPYDQCSGTNVAVSVNTATNGVCPRVITRTWTLTDVCGNSTNWSQTVTVVATNPPLVLCSNNNLVPNGQFETYSPCPTYTSQLNYAAPWFNPTAASPDYFNACAVPASLVSVPANFAGTQAALSGQGYAGAVLYTPDPNDASNSYREYIEVPLAAPLSAGQSYLLSFHVNLGDFCAYAIAEIGGRFSTGPLVDYANQVCLPVVPQVQNPAGNVLASTNSWMLVQGIFTATGGENYLTLGNFLSDLATTAVPAAGTNTFAYYFFDDVAVTPVCMMSTNKTLECGLPIAFDEPVAFDPCGGTNLDLAVATVTNSLCPFVAVRTWTFTNSCGAVQSWSQTLTVVDTSPPLIICSTNNLVPNGDFESYTNCPNNLSETEYAAPWFTPTQGTSDYFNACAGPGGYASVPANLRGYQVPLSGNGYAGAVVYSISGFDPPTCYREYIEAPLVSPLVAGQAYQVSFYASLAECSGWAIAELGAHFSVGPATNYTMTFLSVIPQVVNPSYNLLTSTSAWMLVQGTFVAAGGEDHITIGNFYTDTNTTAVPVPGGGPCAAAYYYDNVSVVPVCGAGLANKTVPCNAPWNFDPPAGLDACSGTNVTVTVAGTTTNTCATVFTRTWTLADQCGNGTNWTQTVTIADPSPLTINCFCLQEVAASLLYTNGCVGLVPNLLQFTNCFSTNCRPVFRTQSPTADTQVGPGSHLIIVSVTDCAGNSNGCVIPFTVAGSPPTIVCPKDLMLFTCRAGAVGYFTPTAFNNTGPVICSPPSGSFFPINLSTLVTCTATNSCGTATCTFGVTVLSPPSRWSCLIAGVISMPAALNGSAQVVYLPVLPAGGLGLDLDNLGNSGQDGLHFELGPAQKFTFSTMLDFNAADGAGFTLTVPDVNGGPPTPWLTFKKSRSWQVIADQDIVNDTSAKFRSIAISDGGDLFSSFTQDGAALGTNVLASLTPAPGVSNALMTVALDFRSREATLGFPFCAWTPDAARKGWDGLIYGSSPRGSQTNQNARLILTPLISVPPAPLTTVDLVASNLVSLAFDNPSITEFGRAWSDGSMTLMRACDDGSDQGVEFLSLGSGGGVTTDLGNAATFSFRINQYQDPAVPNQEQLFEIRGWPPGTTINRPPPPKLALRLAQNSDGTGIDCAADYTDFGIDKVTLQLWNGSALVSEKLHVPAAVATPLVTLSGFPGIIGCPGMGVLSLSSTNPFVVSSGLDCPSTGCVGTELRILPEASTFNPAPVAFGPVTCSISQGMDNVLYRLETTPACAPIPLNVVQTSGGVTLSWGAAGFHLQGAENLEGPWYDLGVVSPVALGGNHPACYFRLGCD